MRQYNLVKKIRPLKGMLLDVDGVLTPGGIWHSDYGDSFKKFDVRDGLALFALHKLDIRLGIITGKESKIVGARAKELRIDDIYQDSPIKMPAFEDFTDKHGFDASEVAFIGDDIIDVPVMKACGFSACPSDGAFVARRNADWVTRASGGNGAIREVVEIIVSAKLGVYPPDTFFSEWVGYLPEQL